MSEINFVTNTAQETVDLGTSIGSNLKGGEVIELTSDLGGGKTTFTRGLAKGFGSTDPVASPTFVINFIYNRPDGKQLWHYDFYRLDEPGIIAAELSEAELDGDNILVVEWGEIVHDILPNDRVIIKILATETEPDMRTITALYPSRFGYLFTGLTR